MQICTYIINRRIKDMQLNRSVVICIIYHNYIIKYLVWRGRVWGFTHTKKKKKVSSALILQESFFIFK